MARNIGFNLGLLGLYFFLESGGDGNGSGAPERGPPADPRGEQDSGIRERDLYEEEDDDDSDDEEVSVAARRKARAPASRRAAAVRR